MKNQIVQDTVTSLIVQARIEEKFRPDFVAAVEKVFDAGAASAGTIVKSVPLTDAEIAAFRDSIRAV